MKESKGHLCPSLSMSFEGGTNQWKSMCAMFAATAMIPLWVIRTMESPLALRLKIFPRIGYARFADLEKMYLSQKIKLRV